jgi:hypothetical protein
MFISGNIFLREIMQLMMKVEEIIYKEVPEEDADNGEAFCVIKGDL